MLIPPSGVPISIHSPRMGRDSSSDNTCLLFLQHFNPLSPHGERLALSLSACFWPQHFNPLSPHGERPGGDRGGRPAFAISIHSPRMGRDQAEGRVEIWGLISIHSPRMGRDVTGGGVFLHFDLFQSTLPAWGETGRRARHERGAAISIHSPRMGRDLCWLLIII